MGTGSENHSQFVGTSPMWLCLKVSVYFFAMMLGMLEPPRDGEAKQRSLSGVRM